MNGGNLSFLRTEESEQRYIPSQIQDGNICLHHCKLTIGSWLLVIYPAQMKHQNFTVGPNHYQYSVLPLKRSIALSFHQLEAHLKETKSTPIHIFTGGSKAGLGGYLKHPRDHVFSLFLTHGELWEVDICSGSRWCLLLAEAVLFFWSPADMQSASYTPSYLSRCTVAKPESKLHPGWISKTDQFRQYFYKFGKLPSET